MNGQEIIDLFDTLTDGLSELSVDNKLALENRKYKKLLSERDWEDTRSSDATLTISSGVITLPASFKKFVPNDFGQDAEWKHVFFIGTTPHPIFNFAERKRFNNYSYHDPANSRIVVPTTLNGQTAELDFYAKQDDLTLATSPVFIDTDKHSIIAYMMAVEHYSIDQSENARSKEVQYQGVVDSMLEDMEYDDTQLKEAGANYA